MDSISTFAKENFDLICLMVGVLGVVIAIFSLRHELKERKKKKEK
jgi:hypothetical protein